MLGQSSNYAFDYATIMLGSTLFSKEKQRPFQIRNMYACMVFACMASEVTTSGVQDATSVHFCTFLPYSTFAAHVRKYVNTEGACSVPNKLSHAHCSPKSTVPDFSSCFVRIGSGFLSQPQSQGLPQLTEMPRARKQSAPGPRRSSRRRASSSPVCRHSKSSPCGPCGRSFRQCPCGSFRQCSCGAGRYPVRRSPAGQLTHNWPRSTFRYGGRVDGPAPPAGSSRAP